jgi:hypothetical protein
MLVNYVQLLNLLLLLSRKHEIPASGQDDQHQPHPRLHLNHEELVCALAELLTAAGHLRRGEST